MAEKYDVPYMKRTRDLYHAQGYTNDYQWAHHDNTPFQPLAKPLTQCKIALVTTAMPDSEEGRKHRAVYSTPVDPIPASLFTAELSWHHGVTHTDDVASFLPIKRLIELEESGVIGSLASEFHSLPTEYSQRNTMTQDGPEILQRCQAQDVDVVVLIPL